MDRIKAILNGSAPARWLFYGDSLTHGAKHTDGRRDFTELFRERANLRSGFISIRGTLEGEPKHYLHTIKW